MGVLSQIFYVGMAGAAGAVSRYFLQSWLNSMSPGIPWGTFAVNVAGCFVFGLLSAVFAEKMHVPPQVKWMIFAGFLGSFTTFSTYISECSNFMLEGNYWLAAANFGVQNIAGLMACFLGIMLAQHML
jgi:CrcB protein